MPQSFGIKKCKTCGKEIICKIRRDILRKKFCSKKCFALFHLSFKNRKHTLDARKRMREIKLNLLKNGWKPIGWKAYNLPKRLSKRGYYFKGSKREHTLIAEKIIGRKLYPNEVVHHKDLNKFNNSRDNLEVMTRSNHIKLHLNLRKILSRRLLTIAWQNRVV